MHRYWIVPHLRVVFCLMRESLQCRMTGFVFLRVVLLTSCPYEPKESDCYFIGKVNMFGLFLLL